MRRTVGMIFPHPWGRWSPGGTVAHDRIDLWRGMVAPVAHTLCRTRAIPALADPHRGRSLPDLAPGRPRRVGLPRRGPAPAGLPLSADRPGLGRRLDRPGRRRRARAVRQAPRRPPPGPAGGPPRRGRGRRRPGALGRVRLVGDPAGPDLVAGSAGGAAHVVGGGASAAARRGRGPRRCRWRGPRERRARGRPRRAPRPAGRRPRRRGGRRLVPRAPLRSRLAARAPHRPMGGLAGADGGGGPGAEGGAGGGGSRGPAARAGAHGPARATGPHLSAGTAQTVLEAGALYGAVGPDLTAGAVASPLPPTVEQAALAAARAQDAPPALLLQAGEYAVLSANTSTGTNVTGEQQAIAFLGRYTARHTRTAAAWDYLALAHYELGEFPQAEQAASRALALDHRDPSPRAGRRRSPRGWPGRTAATSGRADRPPGPGPAGGWHRERRPGPSTPGRAPG